MAQRKRLLLIYICLLFSSWAPLNVQCKASCHKAPPPAKQVYSTVSALVKAKKLSILGAALKAAKPYLLPQTSYNFESTVKPFKGTFFLPSNQAFEDAFKRFDATQDDLLSNKSTTMLTTLLRYHIIRGRSIYSKNLKGSASYKTDEGSNVTVSFKNSVFSVTGHSPDEVISIGSKERDFKCTQTAAQIIEGVLLPPPPAPHYVNVTAALANITQLSSMLAAVQAAKLDTVLGNPDTKLTVFAPSNDAFVAALGALGLTLDDLLSNPPLLLGILTHSIRMNDTLWQDNSLWMYSQPRTVLKNGMMLTMADLQNTTVSRMPNGKIAVNGGINTATIVDGDITAGAGIIHVMDAVLLPASP